MCTKHYYSLFLSFLLMGVFILNTSSLQAQSFDHEPYPKLDFDFVSLDLTLGVQPQNLRIDGEAKYLVQANIGGADTLTLYASHLDINNVSVDGSAAEFSLQNDSLFIPVDDSAEVKQSYEVTIRYSGRAQFGMHRNRNEVVWTSLLPKAQRHWVPIVDHPQVELQTNFTISVPSGVQVWATGKRIGEEAISVDAMKYQFSSQQAVPASSLSLAIGAFQNQSASVGSTKINVAVEQAIADQVEVGQLLQKTSEYLGMIEKKLQRKYPYEVLHIVALDDHRGETKSWGAATVFLYQNRGKWDAQLMRGVIGQWLGIQQRERQWSQADAMNLYQTFLFQELAESDSSLTDGDVPEGFTADLYDNFGPERWNRWQQGINEWQPASVRAFMKDSMTASLQLGDVVDWDDYAQYWYEHTGQPLFNKPQFATEKEMERSSGTASDTLAYEVYYDFNEAEGTLTLNFKAVDGFVSELTTLQAQEVYPGRVDTSEVTFTGQEDAVVLQVDPTISTLRLGGSQYSTLTFDEYKPASFLLYELRSDAPVGERAKAARRLGYHSENPDLQLAIQDFMSQDLAPEVEAGLLLSLADITAGASGTEQTFLDALKSEHRVIREAGLMALQNYSNNPTVVNTVKSIAVSVDEFSMFKKGVQVLTAVMSRDTFAAFAESVVQSDTKGQRAIFVIQELANMGQADKAIEQAKLFTGEEFSYDIRSRAYQILIQHDLAASNWLVRAEELSQTADPRIRFLIIRGLQRNMNDEVRSFLSEYEQDEYDLRVHQKIEDILYE